MNENTLFSINRLVDFGMSLAIAQQMVYAMNIAVTNMHVPGVMNPIQAAPHQFYYVILEGVQAGPFSEQELSRLISEKKIAKESYIWKPGLIGWEMAGKLPEILKLVALSPPPFNEST
jgi:hypothetical protein